MQSEVLLTSRAFGVQWTGVRVLLEVVRAHEEQERGDFLHQAQVLVLDHRLVALSNFLIVLKVDELFERAQVLVQFSLDIGLRRLKVCFICII